MRAMKRTITFSDLTRGAHRARPAPPPSREGIESLVSWAGQGALLPRLRDASPEAVVVGLDRTQPMVALGPRACLLLVGDAVRVPFRDRSSTSSAPCHGSRRGFMRA